MPPLKRKLKRNEQKPRRTRPERLISDDEYNQFSHRIEIAENQKVHSHWEFLGGKRTDSATVQGLVNRLPQWRSQEDWRIRFLGYCGATIGQRMLSVIDGGIRRVALDLVDRPQVSLEDIERFLRKGLAGDRKLAEPFFDTTEPLPDVMRRVDTATDIAGIFDVSRMPLPENALDMLCG